MRRSWNDVVEISNGSASTQKAPVAIRAWFLREVTPGLDDVPLSAIARVTGLSLAGCSRYRTGERVPHPRHPEALFALVKRRRRHCDDCIPAMRAANARKAVAAARKALAVQAAAGKDPRKDPEVNRRWATAISETHRRNREWKREHSDDRRDEAWFRSRGAPRP